MKVTLNKGMACGKVNAPPSKSYAHRYLIASMLCGKKCTVSNVYLSEDILATADCIKAFGYNVTIGENSITVEPTGKINEHPVLNCRESGSTLRFLIPVALALTGKATFTGTQRLISRGISIYEDIAKEQGIQVVKDSTSITFCGKLKAGEFNVQGNISSQYITGLLFALSALKESSVINIIPPVESRPYIDITLDVLSKFGVDVLVSGNRYAFDGKQGYSAINAVVEGDYSNSAFLDAFNYLGGNVQVGGLNEQSLQGDRVYKEYFKKLNSGYATLDISNAIDLGPVLFAFAALKSGARFTGTARLKIKESDRAQAMKQELEKFGAKVNVGEDFVEVLPAIKTSEKVLVCGHNDHRIVMALSLFLCVCDVGIDGAQAVSKSYPNYFDVLEHLGVNLQYED